MIPAPKIEYKKLIIPMKINDKIGIKYLRINMQQNELGRKMNYIMDQKIRPQLEILRFPYPKEIKSNFLISISN